MTRASASVLDGGDDSFENAWEVLEDLFVAEADHVVVDQLQRLGARLVPLLLHRLVVDGAVDLDHQAGGRAVEIEDEAADGVLPAELDPAQLPVTECLP